jgi:GDP-4-dehydro-6-deoxy-D-mannose reductase
VRVLVTGVGGFSGPVVTATLVEAGHHVHGLVQQPSPRTSSLPLEALHVADVADAPRIARLVAAIAPEGVIHLAALSFVPAAERDPPAAYRVNVEGTLAVLAAVRAEAPGARVVAVTSSEIYGAVAPSELPITEDAPLRPRTVYGASKAAADVAAGQWARAYGMAIVRARPFNHSGPGQDPAFVCSALARQLALVEAGRQRPEVRVGNLDPVRDFSDVRDIAAGYVALLERGRAGEAYNLCAGEGASIAEVLAILRTQARVPVRVRADAGLGRTADVPRVVGSHERVTADTGWRPRFALSETLVTVLDDWRRRVAAGE